MNLSVVSAGISAIAALALLGFYGIPRFSLLLVLVGLLTLGVALIFEAVVLNHSVGLVLSLSDEVLGATASAVGASGGMFGAAITNQLVLLRKRRTKQ